MVGYTLLADKVVRVAPAGWPNSDGFGDVAKEIIL